MLYDLVAHAIHAIFLGALGTLALLPSNRSVHDAIYDSADPDGGYFDSVY